MTKPVKNNLFGLSGSLKDQLAQKMLEKRLKKVTEAKMQTGDVLRTRKSLQSNSKTPDEFWDVSAKGSALRKLHLMDAAAIGPAPYPFVTKDDEDGQA